MFILGASTDRLVEGIVEEKTADDFLGEIKRQVQENKGAAEVSTSDALKFIGLQNEGTSQVVHASETGLNVSIFVEVCDFAPHALCFLYPGQVTPRAERLMKDILTDVKAGVKDLTAVDVSVSEV